MFCDHTKSTIHKSFNTANNRTKMSDKKLVFEDRYCKQRILWRCMNMSSQSRSNRTEVPEAKAAMDRFKTEVASELGVNLKEGYNGDLTSREAGSIGGEMVRRMVKSYEESIK